MTITRLIEPDMPVMNLADYGEGPSLPHLSFRIAGLQYHDYNKVDDLIGRIRPKCGDRLELQRQPGNPQDANAVEIRWRNGRLHLGHVPRTIALHIAPLLDVGHAMRCYAMLSGNGSGWSVWALLVSQDVPAQLTTPRP